MKGLEQINHIQRAQRPIGKFLYFIITKII